MPRRSKDIEGLVRLVPAPLRERLAPPARLNAEQTQIWRDVTATRPPEWFDAGNAPLLEAYCVAVHELRRLSAALAEQLPGTETYAGLVRLKTALMQQTKSLATAMRLTQQSTRDAQTAFRQAAKAAQEPARKPWEFTGDEPA